MLANTAGVTCHNKSRGHRIKIAMCVCLWGNYTKNTTKTKCVYVRACVRDLVSRAIRILRTYVDVHASPPPFRRARTSTYARKIRVARETMRDPGSVGVSIPSGRLTQGQDVT